MRRIVLRVVAVLAGVAVVAVAAVAGADAWRAGVARPQPCGSLLAEPRGELRDDGDVLSRAWAALTDPDVETIGELAGSRFVLPRSCVLFAGRFGGVGDPHVVVAEATVTGYRTLFRIAEVQLRDDGPDLRATAAHARLLGSELKRGVVLPLSGYFLAGDADVVAARVATGRDGFRTWATAGAIADGVFNLGAVTDRTLAPATQGEDVPAVVVLDRGGSQDPRAAMVPVVPAPAGGPVHRPTIALAVDGEAAVDDAILRRIAPVLPLLPDDPRFLAALDRSVQPTTLLVTTAADGARVEVTVAYGSPRPAVPSFAYLVRDGIAEPVPAP
ncbi:hypothetical protein [Pseudonocardia sp. DLS-67]